MSSSDGVNAASESNNTDDIQENAKSNLSESDNIRMTSSNGQPHSMNNNISLRYWSTHRMKKFICIWLDQNIDETDKNYQNSINQLQQIISSTKVFTDVNLCIDFIMEIEYAKFFLIVSESIAKTVIPPIHDTVQLDSIYIFSTDDVKHEQCTSAWKKVEGVFFDISSICDQLQRNIKHGDQDGIPTNVISTASTFDLNGLDQSFMYSQLLTEILLEMEYEKAAKKDFIELCRKQYHDNKVQLHRINDFERDYESHSALWWYIKESFIVSMLSSALRTQNIEVIIKMGFYIKDLYQQIKQIYLSQDKSNKMTIYRGQVMAKNDFVQLEKNIGCLIAFTNFLSTTTNSPEALLYAESAEENSELIGIIFEVTVDPSISSIPFVPLSDVNDIPFCENEILFSMHSVFRIDAIEQVTDYLWSIDMTLTSDTDEQLQCLAQSLRNEIEGPNPLHRLGKLLIKMGEFDKAEEIFQTLLHTTSNVDREQLVPLYDQFGYIFKEKGDFTSALYYHQTALEIHKKLIIPNPSALARIYNNIGEVHQLKGDYLTALRYYEETVKINEESLAPNHLELTTIYNNISQVYNLMGNYAAAVSYLQKTLALQEKSLPLNDSHSIASSPPEKTSELQEKSLPFNHPDLATTYENIGQVYYAMGEYSVALSHYQKALEILQKSLPPSHPSLAITHNNIGQVCSTLGEHSTALSHHEKALEIQQTSLPFNHPDLAATHSHIGSVYDSMANYPIALSHLQKTLVIQEGSLPSNHPQLATTYEHIGRVYYAMEEYSIALSNHEKALEIRQKSLPCDHPLLATTHNNIGQAHNAMQNFSIARSDYQKALEIQQKSLVSSHPDLVTTYNNIGKLCVEMRDYKNAVSNYKKMLKIQQVILPSDHILLAITCNNIGHAHQLKNSHSDALFYFEKALKIQQKTLPSNHPSLAITRNNIGKMHQLTGDYSLALSYYETAFDIRAKSFPSNHPSLAESHHYIAMVLNGLQRHDSAIDHSARALNIARHSCEPNPSDMEKYESYHDEILHQAECSETAMNKNFNQWSYPCLLVLHSQCQSRLHSIMFELTDGHLMPPRMPSECLSNLKSNEQVQNIVFEIMTDSSDERDRLLANFSSIRHIESIYVLGKSSQTSEQRYKFFSSFPKVSIFCEDEEELAVRWALDTANNCRRLGGEYAKQGDKDLARDYFQRGKELYKRLAQIIGQTKPETSK